MTFHDETATNVRLPLVSVAPSAQDTPPGIPSEPPLDPPNTPLAAHFLARMGAYWRALQRLWSRFVRFSRESAFAPTWLPERWRGPEWIYTFAAASVVCTVIVTGGLVLLVPDFSY